MALFRILHQKVTNTHPIDKQNRHPTPHLFYSKDTYTAHTITHVLSYLANILPIHLPYPSSRGGSSHPHKQRKEETGKEI